MYVFVCLAILACACGAPLTDIKELEPQNFVADWILFSLIAPKLLKSQDLMYEFPMIQDDTLINENKYVIDVAMPRYKAEEITVSGKPGRLLVEAITSFGNSGMSSSSLQFLPDNVVVPGSWYYEQGHVKIVFDLK